MSFWTAAVIIVAIWGVVQAYKARHGIISDEHGNETRLSADDTAAKREIEELRERIKVLERIATTTNSSEAREIKAISEEIESLRDR